MDNLVKKKKRYWLKRDDGIHNYLLLDIFETFLNLKSEQIKLK